MSNKFSLPICHTLQSIYTVHYSTALYTVSLWRGIDCFHIVMLISVLLVTDFTLEGIVSMVEIVLRVRIVDKSSLMVISDSVWAVVKFFCLSWLYGGNKLYYLQSWYSNGGTNTTHHDHHHSLCTLHSTRYHVIIIGLLRKKECVILICIWLDWY